MEILLSESQVLQDDYCRDLKLMSSDEGWHLRFYVLFTVFIEFTSSLFWLNQSISSTRHPTCRLNIILNGTNVCWAVCKRLDFNNWVRGGAVTSLRWCSVQLEEQWRGDITLGVMSDYPLSVWSGLSHRHLLASISLEYGDPLTDRSHIELSILEEWLSGMKMLRSTNDNPM